MNPVVGDRVRINKCGRERWCDNNFGTGEGLLINVSSGGVWYGVKWDKGGLNSYYESDLDIIIGSLENE